MHFLIDCDSVIYKAGCANEERWWNVIDKETGDVLNSFQYIKDAKDWTEKDPAFAYELEKIAGPVHHALANAKTIMEKITGHDRCSSYEVYIGGKDNYRKILFKDYKATRDPNAKPIQEEDIRQYLINVWGAQVVDGQEVDDEIGIRLSEDTENNVCVSIDKDLDNVAGWHYNYDKESFYFIDKDEATYKFYCQILTGDSTDNIPGLKGIGPAKAYKMMQGIDNENDMCYNVWQHYLDHGHNYDYFLMNARLLWIRQKRDEIWQPPLNLQ